MAAEIRQVGRLGDELHETAERVRAVQRALRAAQHFDPRKVGRVEIGTEHRTEGETGARPERRIVDIDADGGAQILRTGAETADDQAIAVPAARLDVEAGDIGADVGEIVRADAVDKLVADRAHRRGDVEQIFLALVGGDNDLVVGACRAALLSAGRRRGDDGCHARSDGEEMRSGHYVSPLLLRARGKARRRPLLRCMFSVMCRRDAAPAAGAPECGQKATASLLLRLCDAACSSPVFGSRLIATHLPSPPSRASSSGISRQA